MPGQWQRPQLLPQLNGSVALNRQYAAGEDGDARSRTLGASLNQTVFDLGLISSYRAQRQLNVAAGLDLPSPDEPLEAGDELLFVTHADVEEQLQEVLSAGRPV